MQEKITYKNIMNCGFKEIFEDDHLYFEEYGFDYTRIELKLTDTIYLDWEKHNQFCELIRVDKEETMNIMSKMKINNLNHLIEIINFFKDEKIIPVP